MTMCAQKPRTFIVVCDCVCVCVCVFPRYEMKTETVHFFFSPFFCLLRVRVDLIEMITNCKCGCVCAYWQPATSNQTNRNLHISRINNRFNK